MADKVSFGIPRVMPDLQESITSVLEALAERQPAAPALLAPGLATLSYGDLGEQLRYVRGQLAGWGFQPGDLVGGVLPSRPELAVAIATVPSACTFAPLDPSLTADAYTTLLARLSPKAVLVPRKKDHPIRAAARNIGAAEIDVASVPGTAGLFTLDLCPDGAPPSERRMFDSRVAYVLTSSGTTGRRKLVPAEHSVVLCYARASASRLAHTPDDVGVHIRPLYFGSGLRSGLMNSLLTGSSIVCLPEGDIQGMFSSLDEYQPTYLSAGFAVFRTIVRRAAEFRDVARRHRFRFLLSGAGALDPDDADRLEQMFGIPMLTGFSSTETSRISLDPLPPAPRRRGSAGLPLVNEVAVLDGNGQIQPRGASGEVVVRGPMVFRGYLDDPELNAASFLDGWFRTGDLGRIDEDGYVFVTGRIKDIINRGGEKISPAEIDLAIESLAGIAEGAAFAVPHPTLGEEVVAAAVREPGADVDEATVVAGVSARLGARKTPRRVYFVDRLPRTDTGKVTRGALAALIEDAYPAPPADQAPVPAPAEDATGSPLEEVLAGVWSSVLNNTALPHDADFFLLGGDSLGGEQLLSRVDQLFGVQVPLELLYGKAGTIAGMAREIERIRVEERALRTKRSKKKAKAAAELSPDARSSVIMNIPPMPIGDILARQHQFVRTWEGARATPDSLIVSFNENGTRPPLFFCLQSAKGVTLLARHLGRDQPVHGLRSALRIFTYTDENVALLAEHYAAEMMALRPEGAFILGGNCQGGRIARAIAMELREHGREVSLLILLEPRTFPRYTGRVALIFARDSHLNPYGKGGDPDALFRRAFPAGYTVDFVTGLHGRSFFSNNVESLMEVLKRRLNELSASPGVEPPQARPVRAGSPLAFLRQRFADLRKPRDQVNSAPRGKGTSSSRKSTK